MEEPEVLYIREEKLKIGVDSIIYQEKACLVYQPEEEQLQDPDLQEDRTPQAPPRVQGPPINDPEGGGGPLRDQPPDLVPHLPQPAGRSPSLHAADNLDQ